MNYVSFLGKLESPKLSFCQKRLQILQFNLPCSLSYVFIWRQMKYFLATVLFLPRNHRKIPMLDFVRQLTVFPAGHELRPSYQLPTPCRRRLQIKYHDPSVRLPPTEKTMSLRPSLNSVWLNTTFSSSAHDVRQQSGEESRRI